MMSISNILYALLGLLLIFFSRNYILSNLFGRERDNIQNILPDIKVKVLQIENSKIPRYITVSGILTYRGFIKCKPERRGQIKFLKQDSICKVDDVIMKLESSAEEANVLKFDGALTKAADSLKRAKSRSKNSTSVSSSEMIGYESDHKIALGDSKRAHSELAKMSILAPFDGKIGIYNFSVGAHINENEILCNYVSDKDIIIDFFVSESDLPSMYTGKKIIIVPNSNDNQKLYEAVIEKIDLTSDAATSGIRIRSKLSEEGDISDLYAGCSVKVSVPVENNELVLNVAESAIEERSGVSMIYICSKNENDTYTASKRPVEVKGRSNGRAIVHGLPPNSFYCIPIRGVNLDQKVVRSDAETIATKDIEKNTERQDDSVNNDVANEEDTDTGVMSDSGKDEAGESNDRGESTDAVSSEPTNGDKVTNAVSGNKVSDDV